MPSELAKQAIKLEPAERLLLLDEIWDSLLQSGIEPTLNPEQMSELRQREDRFDREGSNGTTWESLKSEIAARRARS